MIGDLSRVKGTSEIDARGMAVAPGFINMLSWAVVGLFADGRALTMVDYEVKQVQRWPIRNSPLAALLDPGKDLARFGKLVPTSTDDVISVEVRDPKRPEYGTITMIFVNKPGAPGGLTLNGWVALDSKNNRTTIRLSNVSYNGAIADSAFSWKDPRPVRRKS